MTIIIGSDHAGYDLKEAVKTFLNERGVYSVHDIGAFSNDPIDYPMIAHELAQAVSEGKFAKGILICGSGIGMSIVANRYKKVRAALCHNLYTVRLSREHNDANVLAMGGRVLGIGLALEMVELFLSTAFEGGRHASRVGEIDGE
ncbi:MAG: ribose 5-phosphate isomerase B [Thermodesulfobacteriota bacterium]